MKNRIDLSIFKKFDFEYKPIGVKFLMAKPDGINRLEKDLAFCEMLKEAQDTEPFYSTKENQECKIGQLILGMSEPEPISESGQIGPKLGVYEDSRANRRLYERLPRLAKNSVNYVAFSSLDKLLFDPDLLIVTAKPSQAEILLRAHGFSTGKMWHARGTTVMGCAWLYLYPYMNGELNIMITGLHHGMIVRHIFPEGLLLLSIPYDLLPEIVNNLKSMEWSLPQYTYGKEEHLRRMKEIVISK